MHRELVAQLEAELEEIRELLDKIEAQLETMENTYKAKLK
tara:strand:- start:1718 stop:1837 length:120 start_codon:yes stop_codon:yes gene_type:complete